MRKKIIPLIIISIFLSATLPVWAEPARTMDNEAILGLIPDESTREWIGQIMEVYDQNNGLAPGDLKRKIYEGLDLAENRDLEAEDKLYISGYHGELLPDSITVRFGEAVRISCRGYNIMLTPAEKIVTFDEDNMYSSENPENRLSETLVEFGSDLQYIVSRVFYNIFNSDFNNITIQGVTRNVIYDGFSKLTVDNDTATVSSGSDAPVVIKILRENEKAVELAYKGKTLKIRRDNNPGYKFPKNDFGLKTLNQVFDISVSIVGSAPSGKLLNFDKIRNGDYTYWDDSIGGHAGWSSMLTFLNDTVDFNDAMNTLKAEEQSTDTVIGKVKCKSGIADDSVRIECTYTDEPFDASFEQKKDGGSLYTEYHFKFKQDTVATLTAYLFPLASTPRFTIGKPVALLFNELLSGKRLSASDISEFLTPMGLAVTGDTIKDRDGEELGYHIEDGSYAFSDSRDYGTKSILLKPDGTAEITTYRFASIHRDNFILANEVRRAMMIQSLYEGMHLMDVDEATMDKIINAYKAKWDKELEAEVEKINKADDTGVSSMSMAEMRAQADEATKEADIENDFEENGISAKFWPMGTLIYDGNGTELNANVGGSNQEKIVATTTIKTKTAKRAPTKETSAVSAKNDSSPAQSPGTIDAGTEKSSEKNGKNGGKALYIVLVLTVVLAAGLGTFFYVKFIKAKR